MPSSRVSSHHDGAAHRPRTLRPEGGVGHGSRVAGHTPPLASSEVVGGRRQGSGARTDAFQPCPPMARPSRRIGDLGTLEETCHECFDHPGPRPAVGYHVAGRHRRAGRHHVLRARALRRCAGDPARLDRRPVRHGFQRQGLERRRHVRPLGGLHESTLRHVHRADARRVPVAAVEPERSHQLGARRRSPPGRGARRSARPRRSRRRTKMAGAANSPRPRPCGGLPDSYYPGVL